MKYWVSCPKFTIKVEIEDSITPDYAVIIDTAPIARKFIGQPFYNLLHWCKGFGKVRRVKLSGAET